MRSRLRFVQIVWAVGLLLIVGGCNLTAGCDDGARSPGKQATADTNVSVSSSDVQRVDNEPANEAQSAEAAAAATDEPANGGCPHAGGGGCPHAVSGGCENCPHRGEGGCGHHKKAGCPHHQESSFAP